MVNISKFSKPESQVWIWIMNTCFPRGCVIAFLLQSLVETPVGLMYTIPSPKFVSYLKMQVYNGCMLQHHTPSTLTTTKCMLRVTFCRWYYLITVLVFSIVTHSAKQH